MTAASPICPYCHQPERTHASDCPWLEALAWYRTHPDEEWSRPDMQQPSAGLAEVPDQDLHFEPDALEPRPRA